MQVAFHSFGCRLNFSETELMSRSLEQRGCEITDSVEAADICVINTCTVTERSDMKCRQLIRSIQRRNPSAKIAVVGCYSQMAGDEIAEIGTEHKLHLARYLDLIEQSDAPIVRTGKISKDHFTIDYTGRTQNTRANLKVQDGCDFFCSFCIIPFARGRSRARVFEDILGEARRLGETGHREIILTGVNIGTYQYDDYQLRHILDVLEGVPGIDRIRISSIEPTTVPEDIFDRMNDPASKLVPFLHLPLQSANDRVLDDMRRRYKYQEYADYVWKAYEAVPGICIGTDIMTGFPTENQDYFEDTLQKLTELPLHYFHVFPYSERQGTRSAGMPERVSAQDIQHRALLLRELSDRKRLAYNQSFVGSVLPVLFEEHEHEVGWKGYTPNYIRAVVSASDNLRGQIKNCRVLSAYETHVSAEIVSEI
ncbi:hypothetical protein CHS0354_006883 [Potamilus streckersoni]|uniref:tRNA (N(6)-L-threonylcarbamoyladenosine(37)-C(2))-methylthiotransferase MtaB n=1 Tax=Potamilus streckersoni TaxID=2493646 RepID=A0AAE0TED0_9BIVA|nr:hypothetical protein CHS0354_006883 [Potamilus streckersoni]